MLRQVLPLHEYLGLGARAHPRHSLLQQSFRLRVRLQNVSGGW
uniref:Uncharacterized protein n=1 Tax=Arundo donax TaxID=35708 RepID=A0A0A9TWJ8_ARUDO